MSMAIGIVGAGGFGRALALAAARNGRQVVLWSRQPREFKAQQIRITTAVGDLADTELIFMAVPSPHVESVARELGRFLDGSHLIVHVSRGLVGPDLFTLSELLRRVTPVRRVGGLAGPLVAAGLADGQPGGGIVGTLFPEVSNAVREAIGGPRLRIYGTDDVVGVELASAFVGMVGVALGYAKAAGYGPATLAVLATRAMAEAVRLGERRGAQERTFAGLAGMGDLIAAVSEDGRPELALGRALFEGANVTEAATKTGAYVEGVAIAKQVVEYAERHGIETPIATAMTQLIRGGVDPTTIVTRLMARPARRE